MLNPSKPKKYLLEPLTLVHLILELVVIVGYVGGILGSLFLAYYALVVWWLLPLTIANIVLALNDHAETEKLDIANFVCALLALVPVLGFLPTIVGIILATISIFKIFPYVATKQD